MQGLVSQEKFVPHTLQHLIEVRAFPTPLPDVFYTNLLADYAVVDDAETSRIVYKSDGLNITGIMCLPKNLQDKNHPILIYNRGGSRDYGMLTLLSVMRSILPFARAGYIVFASNYRGNDGGEGVEEFGGRDVDDVIRLLTIAKTNPAWDGKNVFMLGHSRGCMMTNLVMKKGVALTAAVAIAGVMDAREIVSEKMVENVYKPLLPGYVESPAEALASRSSICWPEDISAPLLLIHGDADKDVPGHQSVRLAVALAKLKKPHELVIIEGGNHALQRFWDVVLEKTLGWFARYRV